MVYITALKKLHWFQSVLIRIRIFNRNHCLDLSPEFYINATNQSV